MYFRLSPNADLFSSVVVCCSKALLICFRNSVALFRLPVFSVVCFGYILFGYFASVHFKLIPLQ